jgi:WD40 repeat protein
MSTPVRGSNPVIDTPGNYCLANNTSSITINSADVRLDLNRKSTNSLSLKNNNIRVSNGNVCNTISVVSVGSGGSNRIKNSSNGLSWYDSANGNSIFNIGYGVTYGKDNSNNDLWIATGSGNGNTLAKSSDGVTWTGLGVSIFTFAGYRSAFGEDGSGNNLWVAAGQSDLGGTTLAYSSDGTTWYSGLDSAFNLQGQDVDFGVDGFNNALWVAVGSSNYKVLKSKNGKNWSPTSNADSLLIANGFSVGFGNSLWVVGGIGSNRIIKSSDGDNWSTTVNGDTVFGSGCLGVSFGKNHLGNNLWVATGFGSNSLAYSTDGNNWTGLGTTILGTNGYYVRYSETHKLWIATGDTGLAYSYKGSSEWFTISPDVFGDGYGIDFGPIDSYYGISSFDSLMVAVGSGTTSIINSTDAITWTNSPNTLPTGYGVAYGKDGLGNNLWVAVGNGTNKILKSSDGKTWSTTANGNTIFAGGLGYGVAFGNNLWVAVGYGTNKVAYSTDGNNWTPSSSGNSIFTTGYAVAFGRYVTGKKLWVAVGNGTSDTIANSLDGITWTPLGKQISNVGFGVSFGKDDLDNYLWVAGGSSTSGTTRIVYSYDGTIWTPATFPGINGLQGVAFGKDSNNNNLWVAVTSGTNKLLYSSNGKIWTAITSINSLFADCRGVAFGQDINRNNIWVVVGTPNTPTNTKGIIYSYDGITDWTLSDKVFTGFGVAINSCIEHKNLYLDSINVKDFNTGVYLCNTVASKITNCNLNNNITGLLLEDSHKVHVENTISNCSFESGFSLENSSNVSIKNCKSISTGSGGSDTAGFKSTNGNRNMFENCATIDTYGNVTKTEKDVAGFALFGENSSTIRNCESIQTLTNTANDTYTVPYGILLKKSPNFGFVSSFTTQSGLDISGLKWSPDSKYIASNIKNDPNYGLGIFKFDRKTNTIYQVDKTSDNTVGEYIYSMSWSPNGKYLAIGGISLQTAFGGNLVIYEFDYLTEKLTKLTTLFSESDTIIYSIDWHPSGRYIAVGGNRISITDNHLVIVEWNEVNETLSSIIAIGTTTNQINSLKWSPDGNYIVRGDLNGSGIYYFNNNSSNPTLTFVVSLDNLCIIRSVDWSNDGKYIVTGGKNNSTTNARIAIYKINKTTSLSPLTQTLVASYEPNPGGFYFSVVWSPDGNYLSVINNNGYFIINRFVPSGLTSSDKLIEVKTFQSTYYKPSWSSDGEYISLYQSISENRYTCVYSALTFPQNNIIENNKIYCNVGAEYASGVGISSSSSSNLVQRNTLYANAVPSDPTTNIEPFISTNTYFSTNDFNGNTSGQPSIHQNVTYAGRLIPSSLTYDIARYTNVELNK